MEDASEIKGTCASPLYGAAQPGAGADDPKRQRGKDAYSQVILSGVLRQIGDPHRVLFTSPHAIAGIPAGLPIPQARRHPPASAAPGFKML